MRRFTLRRELFRFMLIVVFGFAEPSTHDSKARWFAPFYCGGGSELAAKETRPMKEDTQELIARIRKNSELTNEEKFRLIDSLRKTKHYGLVWKKKPEEVEENQRNRIPVLTEVRERAIVSEAADAPNHILIEGDNLDALVALTYTHEGKIDVIYIDPPYNTGKKDFRYNDSYVDAEDSFRHSKWLSFMERRLLIAKKLLSSQGVVFVSIGDDELCNLKLLCDEIFGENNFIENYVWESTFRPDNSSPILRRNAEFVLCYAKNKANISYFRGVSSKTEGMPSLTKGKEKLKQITFPANCVKTTLPDGLYKKGLKDNGKQLKWELVNDARVKDGIFITEVVLKGHSYWATDKKVIEELAFGTEIWIKSESFVPYYKKNKESISRPTKILDADIVNDYLFANTQINGVFGTPVFNNPKPTSLISFLCNFTDNPNATILDFFAGSGTTLHATMALNAEDGGHRQCILVTNNENRICEDVTYVRNKKVIEGYVNAKGETVKGLTANSLRYYKTDFIDRDKTAQNRRALAAASADLLRIREDSYNELNHFGSLKLKPSVARYFTGNGKHILLILNENAIEYFVKEIKDFDSPAKFKVYVFSPGDYAYDDEFTDVADRVELCAVPSSVYNAYEKVLPKRVRDVDEEESDDFAENGGDGFLGDARNFENQGEEKPGQNENDVEE